MAKMHPRGVLLVGKFQGVEPVRGKDGKEFPGLHKLVVDVSMEGGEPVLADAAFNVADRDTGEPTKLQEALMAEPIPFGAEVAIKCKVSTRSGSAWANKEAVAVSLVADLAWLGQAKSPRAAAAA